MTGLQSLVILGALCFAIALLVWAAVRGGTATGEAKAVTAKREAVRTAEALQHVAAGQVAAAKIRKRRESPADIVRKNDGAWP